MKVRQPHGEALRWRPRQGEPRCLLEVVAQFLWRWRIELFLLYIAVMITVGVRHELGY